MRNNSFKSAQHSANWVNKELTKKNKKQPVKQFSKEEKEALAAKMNVGVSNKPAAPMKQTPAKEVKDEQIDWSQIPAGLMHYLSE